MSLLQFSVIEYVMFLELIVVIISCVCWYIYMCVGASDVLLKRPREAQRSPERRREGPGTGRAQVLHRGIRDSSGRRRTPGGREAMGRQWPRRSPPHNSICLTKTGCCPCPLVAAALVFKLLHRVFVVCRTGSFRCCIGVCSSWAQGTSR